MSLGLSWVRFDFTALKVPAASIDHCPKRQAAQGERLWQGQGQGQGRRQAHRGGARKRERERERKSPLPGVNWLFWPKKGTDHDQVWVYRPPTSSDSESATDPCSIFVYASHSHTHFSLLSQFHRVFYSSLSRFSPSTFLTKRSAHYHHHYPHRLRLPISSPPSPTSSLPSPASSLSALGTHS